MPRLVVNSQFFLDLREWEALRESVLPELRRTRGALRVWSAGCHVGKEPYSLAILLEESGDGFDDYLLATDNDEALLERARAGGPFDERDLEQLSEAQRRRHLCPGGPPFFVADALRRRVTFERHDLLHDPYGRGFAVILFRDVQPFLGPETAGLVHRQVRDALLPGGVLFVGATDTVPHWEELGFDRLTTSLYRRRD